jgi:hypothetical protein
MSLLLDATNYTPSSDTGTNFRATSGVTQATVDVTISDASVVASDVMSTVQPCTQRNTTTHTQQQRQSLELAASKRKSCFKIV